MAQPAAMPLAMSWSLAVDEYNAGDRKSIRKAQKAAAVLDTQRLEAVANILRTIPGRAWMHDLLDACHVFATGFSPDPYIHAYSAGERNIGLRLLADVQAHPELYLQMMVEANGRRTESAARINRSNPEDGDGGDQGSEPEPELGLEDGGNDPVVRIN